MQSKLSGLKQSHLLEELTGSVHLTQYDAVASINPALAHHTLEGEREPLVENVSLV